jgi:hypothetical protein
MSERLFEFNTQRDLLVQWADRKCDLGLRDYWESRNQVSIDGKPTRVLSDESVPGRRSVPIKEWLLALN